MCAAREEIDQISECEKAARDRIEEAEKRARSIQEETDKEANALIAKAEHDAKKRATKTLSEIEGKKGEIEKAVLSDAEQKIDALRKSAEKKKAKASEAALKILIEEA